MFRESLPLGLKLKRTLSFIKVIETRLAQGENPNHSLNKTYENITTFNNKRSSSEVRASNFRAQIKSEKLKASNFCALQLRIGNWEVFT